MMSTAVLYLKLMSDLSMLIFSEHSPILNG